jgi:predicted TIM-barrel fold metal-dependent hydrolase
MSRNGHISNTALRKQLNHPIIDADGHWLEFGPLVQERLRKIGGDVAVEGFSSRPKLIDQQLSMSVAERRRRRIGQQGFWGLPTKNTRDRATAIMPQLLYERMDEFGFDFSVMYPTVGLGLHTIAEDETRRVTCRAFNTFSADYFRDFSDRLTPAAVIPMYTPEEAIAELEHVKHQLGLKVVMLGSMMRRQIPAIAEEHPKAASVATWYDVLGLDSEYDYDPVWAKCVELGFSPTFHSGSKGYGLRVSPSNFCYNHIGHFAAASEAVCKALFLGGVTRRFPTLKFGFLEGGVGWACQLYADLIEHWEKRKLDALEEVKPENLDVDLLRQLAESYGSQEIVDALQESAAPLDTAMQPYGTETGGIENLDDYSACQIEKKQDFHELFAQNFYFGCEADDKMNALAFNRKHIPLGSQINALFGSDIGHFDVTDMAGVLPEAYELVEDGLMDADNFRDFVVTNPVHFLADSNPDFFTGTVVEKEAAAVLAAGTHAVKVNGTATSQLSK